jgi:tetratricopeptide (TPR) repeat protein
MIQKRRFWPGLPAVALGALSCLAGCQHGNLPPADNALLQSGPSKAVELAPAQLADLQVACGRSLEKRGEEDQAVARYSEAVKLDPRRADAWLRLAILHDQQGKFTDSGEMYREALAHKPGDPDIFCNIGYSFYLQQRWAEAEMNLRQAITLQPDHARAHNNLGLLLARTRRDNEALAEFRKGGCSDADAHTNLAFALALERRWPEARGHYRQALAADASCETARLGLQRLEAVLAKTGDVQNTSCAPAVYREASQSALDSEGKR